MYLSHISAILWLDEIAVSSYVMLCMEEPRWDSSQLEVVSSLPSCVEHPLNASIACVSLPGKYLRYETGDHKHGYIY